MGFNIRHIKKYVNWVSNDRKNYKKDCKVSKEYAKLNRKLNRAMLVNNTVKCNLYRYTKEIRKLSRAE